MMLTVILVVTMFLSDIINNAARVVLMAPIAIGVANGINASVDPFLMAVAIGASCAFLTTTGHQTKTMVMEPGGSRFGDYRRIGLSLEILIITGNSLITLILACIISGNPFFCIKNPARSPGSNLYLVLFQLA